MGNKVYLAKSVQPIFDISKPLKDQLEYMGGQYIQHLERIELYRLKNQQTKFPTIFEKQHANTVLEEQGPILALHQQQTNLEHPNLIKYYGMNIETEIATDLLISKWYYEALFRTTRNLVIHHNSYKSLIVEKDLFKILYQICLALYYLQTQNILHQHIQPDSIYLDSNGSVKLIPKGILRSQSGYSLVLQKKGTALLSPELTEQLRLGNINPDHDPYKSDVYSLGMTFLELMTLKNCFECYSHTSGFCGQTTTLLINEELVEERLLEAEKNGYSMDLLLLVKNMLKKDPNYRITIESILNSKEMQDKLNPNNNQFTPLKPKVFLDAHQPTIPSIQVTPEKQDIIIEHQAQNQISQISLKERQLKETLIKEKQNTQQLEIQLNQQIKQLQFQQNKHIQQQQVIEQQQLLIFQLQEQIKHFQAQLNQNQLQLSQTPNFQLIPINTPPITFASPIKHSLNDFTESIEIQNRVNQALAQSRQTISKVKS